MWSARIWLLLAPVHAVRKETLLGATLGGNPSHKDQRGDQQLGDIDDVPVDQRDDQQPGDADDLAFVIKRGPRVPIPGEFNITGLPLQWHIQHYVALLKDHKLFVKYAMGNEQHHVAKFVDWPSEHPLFNHFKFLRGPKVYAENVREYIARYTLVMKIWILQAVRGLEAGRLAEHVEKWFKINSSANRAYLMALLQRMYAAFGHLCYRFAPHIPRFAEVRYAPGRTCRVTRWRASGHAFDMWLGENFFRSAQHNLRSWNAGDGTRVGTLLHEVSHLVKEESFALYRSGAWGGDAPGRKCGDDGRLGTDDYAYGNTVLSLNERDARHNADNVQFFIETSVLSEIDGGHAIEITVDGNLKGETTVTTTSSVELERESTALKTSLGPTTTSLDPATTEEPEPAATTTEEDRGTRQGPQRVLLLLSLSALSGIST